MLTVVNKIIFINPTKSAKWTIFFNCHIFACEKVGDKMKNFFLLIIIFIFGFNGTSYGAPHPRLVFSECGIFQGQKVSISWLSPGGEGGANILIGNDRHKPLFRINGLDWGKKPFESETGAKSGSERLRCDDDVKIFEKYLSIRHGNNLDLFTFVSRKGQIFNSITVRLEDGDQHGLTNYSKGPQIKLGKNKDIWIQYCVGNENWTSSDIHRGNEPSGKLICGNDAIVFFKGSSVLYDPHRIPSAPVNNIHGDCLIRTGKICM